MKDEDVILRVRDLCGGGGRVRTLKRSNPKHNDTFCFAVTGKENVRRVLTAVKPWLGERRAAKARELLELL